MRKSLFLFVVGFLATLGVNAATYTWPETGEARVILTDGDSKTQLVEVKAAGDLAAFFEATKDLEGANALRGLGSNSDRWILKVSGPLNASDLQVLNVTTYPQLNNFNLLDFSDATLAEGVTLFSKLQKNTNKAYVLTTENTEPINFNTWQGQTNNYLYGYYADDTKSELVTFVPTGFNTTSLDKLAVLLDETMTLKIEGWSDGTYIRDYPTSYWDNLKAEFAKTEIGCIDFAGYNISSLGFDFSGFNEKTHYIVIPTASENTQGTKYPDIDDEDSYNYGENIWGVMTYNTSGETTFSNTNYDGFSFHANVLHEPTMIFYLTNNGHDKLLDSDGKCNPVIKRNPVNATRLNIVGKNINEDDMKALGQIEIPTVDLMHATLESYTEYKSQYVEYLALPDNLRGIILRNVQEINGGYTSPFPYLTNLKSVGTYDPTYNLYTVYSAKNVQDTYKTVINTDTDGNPIYAKDDNGSYITSETYDGNGDYIEAKDADGNLMVLGWNGSPVAYTENANVPMWQDASDWSWHAKILYYETSKLPDGKHQIASVGKITRIIEPNTKNDRMYSNSTFASGLTHMQMLGYFTPEDLSTDGDYYTYAGLNNATVEWIDLSKAYFPTKSDMAFAYHNLENSCGRIIPESVNNHYAWDNKSFYHIDLPTHPDMDEIPDAAFFNYGKLGRGTSDDATEETEKGWHSYYEYYTFSYDDQGNETVTPANFEGLCIPTNYKYIRRGAFLGCNGLNHVYTTQSNEGEEEGAWDHGYNTITLSPYVKELETFAFWIGGDNGALHDGIKGVYPLGKTAPKCETRTFSTKMLCNNNGYNAAHPISIASYQGGQQGLSILRYPNGLTEDEEKLYTDITRVYSLIDETGLVDGDGNAIYWPTQSEITRTYMQGQLGYIWNDWDPTMAWGEYPAQSSSTYYFDGDCVEGQFAANVAEGHLTASGQQIGYNDSWVEASQNTKVWFNERIGWHEFVVAWPGHIYNIDIQKEEVYYELGWYTFCVPTDLTVEQVAKYMGVVNTDNKINKKVFKTIKKKRASNYDLDHGYSGLDDNQTAFGDVTEIPASMTYVLPDIRVLSAVERNLVDGHIQLHLSRDLAGNYAFDKTILNPIATEGYDFEYENGYFKGDANTVLIKGGYPYLVRPIVPKSYYDSYIAGTDNYPGPGKFTMSRVPEPAGIESGVGYPGYKKTIGGNQINVPYENYNLQATDPGHEGEDETYEKDGENLPYIYNFIGRYDDGFIPQYAYYMGTIKDTSKPSILWDHKFYRAVNKADKKDDYYTSKKWGAYSAIITALGNADYYVYVPSADKEEDKDKKKSSYVYDYNDTDDDTVFKVGNAKFSVVFDGDEEDWEGVVDAIQSVTDGQVSASVNGKVYNVNGQMVGTSIQNLNKGLYIVNGKKFVVK